MRMTIASGLLVKAEDNGGMVEYKYYSHGKPREIKVNSAVSNTFEYNSKLQQTKLIDANAGTIEYVYNSLGELLEQTDQKNNKFESVYDALGRITQRTEAGGNNPTLYEYHDAGIAINFIEKVTEYNGTKKEFAYDHLGRISSLTEKADAEVFTTSYTYDAHSKIKTVTYPGSGLKLEYEYNANGYLTAIKDVNNDKEVFRLTETNRYGQVKSYDLGNGVTTEKEYTPEGILNRIFAESVQYLEYDFDAATGNLKKRIDNYKGLYEEFTYDALNRLTKAEITDFSADVVTIYPAQNINYMQNGNIEAKSDAGGPYFYHGQKQNAVIKIDNPSSTIPNFDQDITYTTFNKVEKITENKKELNFIYTDSRERIKTELKDTETGDIIYTRYFATDYEKTISEAGTEEVHYINSPDGLIAIYVVINGIGEMHYVYKDHLGSVVAITDDQGDVEIEQNFDAWGRLRNPNDWTYTNISTAPSWLYRGYTEHEHLAEFNLINMNGRLYDPLVGRMLSPDNFVQNETATQAFNRYSYCANNPLKYTDPSGDFFVVDDLILGVIGGTVNLLTNLGNVHSFGQGLGYFGVGFVGGALTTYITPVGAAAIVGAGNAALGSYINTGHVDFGAVIQGGITSAVMGGITMGLGGALSPVADKVLSGIASPVLRGALTQGLVGSSLGAISGGIGTSMNGGNFWQGAGQGALWGGGIGLATGAYSGYDYAKANNLNPWTGESLSKPAPQISHGTFTKGQIRSNVSGDYDIALQEWNKIQQQYGVTPTQGVPSGFTTTLPNGSVVSGQFYYGGGVNPTGYNIKLNMTPPPPTINKIPPIHIRYDWR